ncbi:MAG: protein kinase [Phycisphaeraceae bacterium]|nr:protein kinase [Phycisphaeraceae bacterium]
MNVPGDHQRVQQVFGDAIEQPVAARGAFLDRACAGPDGAALRAEVESLLAAYDDAADYLAEPTIDGHPSPLHDPPADHPSALRDGTGVSPHPAPGGSSPRDPLIGAMVGPYRLGAVLGEGGFGVVYLATQQAPIRREVALKIIRAEMDSRQVVARFQQERQALAVMDHPGIARVLDAGETASGRPYFVMELVRGDSITAFCDRHRLSITQRLHLFCDVCAAVQHAHQKGVIHRDLKSSNVLVSMIDGRAVAKVIDFGIAKAVGGTDAPAPAGGDVTAVRTIAGQFLGTPEYMSPEQAGGSGLGEQDIDTRTDIYSLGVLLYQVLTGALPFDPGTLRSHGMLEIRRRIREVNPPRPSTRLRQMSDADSTAAAQARMNDRRDDGRSGRSLVRRLRGDLDWIVMKAMEKARDRRYPTASELAADVRRHLDGEPVQARPPSRAYRMRRFIARNRAAVSAAAAIAASLVLGIVGTTLGLLEARAQRDSAVASGAAAERLAYSASIAAADASLRAGDARAALRHLDAAPEPHRGWEWRLLRRHADPSDRSIDTGHGRVLSAALSHDDSVLFTIGADRHLRAWDTDRLTTLAGYDIGFAPMVVIPAPTGPMVLLIENTDQGRRVVMDNWRTGERLWECDADPPSRSGFSPDGRRLVLTGIIPGGAHLVDAATGAVIQVLPVAQERIHACGFRADGNAIRCMLPAAGELVEVELAGHAVTRWPIAAAAREPHLDPGDGRLVLRDPATGDLALVDPDARRAVTTLAGGAAGDRMCRGVSPDGELFAIVTDDHTGLELWDAVSGQRVVATHTFGRYPASFSASVLFTRDGTRMYSAHHSGLLYEWSLPAQDVPSVIHPPARTIFLGVAVSPDGALAACGSWGNVQLWDLASGGLRWFVNHGSQYFQHLAFSPDGERIAAAESRGRLLVLSAADGSTLHAWDGAADGSTAVAWTPDGASVLLAGADGTVTWIDARTGDIAERLPVHDGPITAMALSRNGRRLLTTAGSPRPAWDHMQPISRPPATPARAMIDVGTRRILMHDRTTRDLLAAALGPGGPGGPAWATGDVAGMVEIVQGDTRRSVRIGARPVYDLAFDDTGTRLFALAVDGLVSVIDVATATPLLSIQADTTGGLAFIPQDEVLLICAPRGLRRLEVRDPGTATREARSRVNRARDIADPLFARGLLSEEVHDAINRRDDLPGTLRLDAAAFARTHGDSLARLTSDVLWHARQCENSRANYQEVARILAFLERKQPERVEAWAWIGAMVQLRLGDAEEAHRRLRPVIGTDPARSTAPGRFLVLATIVAHARGDLAFARACWSAVEAITRRDGRPTDQTQRMLYEEAWLLMGVRGMADDADGDPGSGAGDPTLDTP